MRTAAGATALMGIRRVGMAFVSVTLVGTAPACWAQSSAAAAAGPLKVVLFVPSDDVRLERSRLERAVPGHSSGPAMDAVRLALKDSEPVLRQAGVRLEAEVVDVADAQAARAAAQRLAANPSILMAITDLPAEGALAVAEGTSLPVLNIGAAEDELRQTQCRANLWHVSPSERMRADAMAQALVARKWSRVLLLTSMTPADAPRAAGVQAAIRRYGLKLVDTRTFKVSADPRERELANPRLLTQGDYDVVWVVDGEGEFATSLPFRTVLPRPVVGDGGLVAVAWSPKFERFGAPQVTRRLQRQAGRPMGSHDWSAWMAGKTAAALAASQPAAGKAAAGDRFKALAALELDGSKGVALSFRSWDGQLRQPLLMSDGQSVIETVPGEGVMHPRNRLDTLGADAPEKLCKARAS